MQEHPTVTQDFIDTSHINIDCQKTHHTHTHKKQLQRSSPNFSTSKSEALEEFEKVIRFQKMLFVLSRHSDFLHDSLVF